MLMHVVSATRLFYLFNFKNINEAYIGVVEIRYWNRSPKLSNVSSGGRLWMDNRLGGISSRGSSCFGRYFMLLVPDSSVR